MTLSDPRHDNSTHPGRMTAAMRVGGNAAAATQGPKVLRVGVVQDGRVREERTLRSPAHVSVGTSEQNSFLLSGAAYPASFRLFERIGDTYHLNFTGGMQGRVALPSGIFELRELVALSQRLAGGAQRFALSEDARGRVVLGDVTFLFHFVERPPLLPKPVLPAAVLRGPRSMDWPSTIAAAFSFLLHFMILGAVYSDWADPVIDDDFRTAGLIDSLKNLPPPPPVEDKATPDDVAEPAQKEPVALQAEPSQAPSTKGRPNRGRPSAANPPSDAALSDELQKLELAAIGSLNTGKPATSEVLKGGDVASAALDAAAASAAGVGSNLGPRLPSGGGPIHPGAVSDLRDLGTKSRGPQGTGNTDHVHGPVAVANVARASTSGGMVSNAVAVVAGLRGSFRACYQRGLDVNPDASGSIRLTIQVGPNGEVSAVSASPSGNLPPAVVSCVQARAQAAQFAAPEGGSAVIHVPVTFVKQ